MKDFPSAKSDKAAEKLSVSMVSTGFRIVRTNRPFVVDGHFVKDEPRSSSGPD